MAIGNEPEAVIVNISSSARAGARAKCLLRDCMSDVSSEMTLSDVGVR